LIIRKDNGKHYDRFRDRLMFPIRDARGRTIGFGGRVMGDEQPKYLNTSDTVLFHKRQELYGLYEARQALRNIVRLVVVEGYMDVVGLARNGIEYAVATLGTATTDEHINQLLRLSDEVVFCFDGDRAGRDAAWKALVTSLPHIREGRQLRFVFLPDGQDPDSFVHANGATAFEEAIANGLALSNFLIGELSAKVDLGSVDGRARLAELARPLLSEIPPGVYKELLIGELAESVGLSAAKLESILASGKAKSANRAGHTPPPSSSFSGRPKPNRPSAVRRALTLLLHHPQAATNLNVEDLAGVDRPGINLLRDLIETVQAEPTLTTAGLLERWRSHEQGRHLGKLAAVEMPDDEDFDPSAELADSLRQLAAAGARGRFELLIEKQRLSKLSDEEKDELRTLGRRAANGG
jgi:DNA primase